MQQFKLQPDGIKALVRRGYGKTGLIVLMVFIASFWFFYINGQTRGLNNSSLFLAIPLALVMVSIGIYTGVQRQKKLLQSYTLTFEEGTITRTISNTPTIAIRHSDIEQIRKHKDGSFRIKGKDKADLILVPAQIDHYSQVESTLQGLQPIVTAKASFFEKYQLLTSLFTVGLMLGVYMTDNKSIVVPAGTILIVILAWGLINIFRSKNIDAQTKKSVLFTLPVVVATILLIIYKLTGFVPFVPFK